MGIIAKSTIQEVNDRLDAVAVIGDYVRLEKRRDEYIGLCPFHNEKTPSFSVNPDLKLYYCFGCSKGGTVISFLMEIDKLSYGEAIEVLAKRFGIPIVYEHSGKEDEQKITRGEELAELYRRVAGSFHYWLLERPEGRQALQYILSRKISMETIKAFKLGYAPADRHWLFRFLSKKGYSEEFLAGSNLFYRKDVKLSFFSNRLMFPITDRQGRVVAFGGRLLTGDGPKYINSSEYEFYKKGHTLFGIDLALKEIKKTGEVYIVEGYMDALALHQAGITNAVAPLGTSLTEEQAKLLRRWAEKAYILFDSDEAGKKACVKAILTCRKNALACAVVQQKENFKDPADILKEAGQEVLQAYVKCFMLDCEYLMFHSKTLFDTDNAEGKSKAIRFMFPYLETLDSEVARELAIEKIAAGFSLDRVAIRNDYTLRQAKTVKEERGDILPIKNRTVHISDELYLLIAVLVNYHLYPEFRTRLLIKDIEDPAAKELFIALEECYIHDELGMDYLLSRISSEELRHFVIERGTSKDFSANPELVMADGVRKILQRRLEKRRKEIVTELHIAKSNAEIHAKNNWEELIAEKMYIDAQLHHL